MRKPTQPVEHNSKKPSDLVSNRAWDTYKNQINRFLDVDAGRQTIIWAKQVKQLLSHGEDDYPKYYRKEIEALCYYNAFRNWPINNSTITGALDDENLSILISFHYLKEKGYLNKEGYWNFDWVEDRFVINGQVYRPSGDTQVAQAKDQALVFMIILKRDRDSKIKFVEDGETITT